MLSSNLEQIIKVRKSLETLSLLIQDSGTDGSGDSGGREDTPGAALLSAMIAGESGRVVLDRDGGSLNQQYFHEDAT